MGLLPILAGAGSALGGIIASRNAANAQERMGQAQIDLAQQVRNDNRRIGRNVLERTQGINRNVLRNQTQIANRGAQQARQVADSTYATQTGQINNALRGALADFQPYADQGRTASQAAQYELGLGAAPAGYRGFEGTPGYQFLVNEMQDATQGSAAAQGGLFSGATLRALQDRRMGLAQQDYGNYFNRLSGQADRGLAAASGMAGARQNAGSMLATAAGNRGANMTRAIEGRTANLYGAQGQYGANMQNALRGFASDMAGSNNAYGASAADAYANQGDARAAGFIGMGNAITGGIENGLALWNYQNNLQNQNQVQPAPSYGGVRPQARPF